MKTVNKLDAAPFGLLGAVVTPTQSDGMLPSVSGRRFHLDQTPWTGPSQLGRTGQWRGPGPSLLGNLHPGSPLLSDPMKWLNSQQV